MRSGRHPPSGLAPATVFPYAAPVSSDKMEAHVPKITGSCACGQVHYSAEAEPVFTGVCHCTECQKETGTAFNIVVAVPQSALSIEGTPKDYVAKGDSGKQVVRKFCPNCGSTLLSEPEVMAGVSILRAGTLDDTSWLKPTMEIYCASAQSWVQLGGGMQRFPGMPSGG